MRYEKPLPFQETLCRFDKYDSNDYYIPVATLTDKVYRMNTDKQYEIALAENIRRNVKYARQVIGVVKPEKEYGQLLDVLTQIDDLAAEIISA